MPGKEQIMDMTVNRLPARTWNWLKMNETVLSSVEPFRQQEIPEGNVFREENETEQNLSLIHILLWVMIRSAPSLSF